jgi:hypothetical protein
LFSKKYNKDREKREVTQLKLTTMKSTIKFSLMTIKTTQNHVLPHNFQAMARATTQSNIVNQITTKNSAQLINQQSISSTLPSISANRLLITSIPLSITQTPSSIQTLSRFLNTTIIPSTNSQTAISINIQTINRLFNYTINPLSNSQTPITTYSPIVNRLLNTTINRPLNLQTTLSISTPISNQIMNTTINRLITLITTPLPTRVLTTINTSTLQILTQKAASSLVLNAVQKSSSKVCYFIFHHTV